jgi:hypothetical protein
MSPYARAGWDPVTGWGSPNAQVLVPLLGKQVPPATAAGCSRIAGRCYAPAASNTSQNTNPSRCTVSPTWQAIGALKMGPAWTNV